MTTPATSHVGPARYPVHTKLRRLGAKWPEFSHSIEYAQWPLPLLVFGVYEIGAVFPHVGIRGVATSPGVLRKIEEMFDRVGPILWPDSKARSLWLYTASANDCCEEYARDLYFEVEADREM